MHTFGVSLSPTSPSEMEPLWVHCAKCFHEWSPCRVPAPMDVVAKALKAQNRCPLCKGKAFMGKAVRGVADGDVLGWLLYSNDTGISSETMYTAITGQPILRPHWAPGVPHDPSDFGRCYRLMKTMAVHGWHQWLPKVSEKFPEWTPFIDAWDELTALYESEYASGQCPKLYARLQALREPRAVAAVDPHVGTSSD
jgi:hypothetical protein